MFTQCRESRLYNKKFTFAIFMTLVHSYIYNTIGLAYTSWRNVAHGKNCNCFITVISFAVGSFTQEVCMGVCMEIWMIGVSVFLWYSSGCMFMGVRNVEYTQCEWREIIFTLLCLRSLVATCEKQNKSSRLINAWRVDALCGAATCVSPLLFC